MKRCIAILLALLVLTACGTGGQAPVSEPESGPSSQPEPSSAPASSEPEPEPDPMPDFKPGRVLSFWDAQGLTPDHPSGTVKGTQAELDRWKAAVREPAIARMDFTDLRHQTALLPVEQEQDILAAMREAEIRLYEGNPDPSTGGGCSVVVYDGEENVLFDIGYMGDFFSVWFAGDETSYYFDGKGSTLDILLTSDYGVPEEPAPPSQSEEDPDLGPQENPDTSLVPETEEQKANHQRAADLHVEIREAFPAGLPKESFSYYTCHSDGGPVILEIGVMDEAAVDAYLSTWTGTKWDTLLKVPGSVSQAGQEKFAQKAEELKLGPDVSFSVTPYDGLYDSEYGKIFISGFLEDRDDLESVRQRFIAFAKEMGIPEDMLAFRFEWRSSSADPNANPDT